MSGSDAPTYNFGRFKLNPSERTLFDGAKNVPLAPKVFDTLLLLVDNQGKILAKERMLKEIWEDSFVEENNLAQNISLIRKLLGESEKFKFIETVPKFGYRFVAPVDVVNEPQIETEITDKVEGAVNTISGIDELRSTSVEGVSQVFITFLLEKNPDIAAQEVRNKIDLIVNDLPVTAEQPMVQKLDTDAAPVVRIAVSAPRSLREVTEIADKQIKRQIEPISGVGNVDIVGGQQREIEVWVDPDKMRAFNISAADVANAVRVQNMELPGGRVQEGAR